MLTQDEERAVMYGQSRTLFRARRDKKRRHSKHLMKNGIMMDSAMRLTKLLNASSAAWNLYLALFRALAAERPTDRLEQ